MGTTTNRDYYTVAEAAERLNVSHSTVWRWVRSGKLPAYRVGGRNLRIKKRDLQRTEVLQGEQPHKSLSLEEARELIGRKPSAEEIQRQKELFEEVQRTRVNRSIAPMTSDELVRRSREKESWYGPEE